MALAPCLSGAYGPFVTRLSSRAAIGLVIVRVESPQSGKVANPLATLPDPCPWPLPPLSRRSLPRAGGLAAAKLLLPLPRPSVALASCLSGAYGPS